MHTPTEIAEYAYQEGANAACRPPYDSSPNGMAFLVGLWARQHGVPVKEVTEGRGYTYTLNRFYKLSLRGSLPVLVKSK